MTALPAERPASGPSGAFGRLLGESVASFATFVTGGVRVLAQHWPQLIGLFLAGWAARMALLWGVTVVSDVSPTVAVLVLPLAPMATLLSLVLMMRAMAPSLPSFSGVVEATPPGQRWRDDLRAASQVLLPFLAVYASAGMLREDVRVFLYDSTSDEWLNTALQDIDSGRADYAPGGTIAIFIVVALIARKLITVKGLAKRHLAWATLAVYVEVLWVITLANAFSSEIGRITDWVTSRQLVAGVLHWWETAVAFVRGLGAPVAAVVDAAGALVANLGGVVIVPVAWLAIGAAVYGHSLRSDGLKLESPEDINRRIQAIPTPVRRVVGHAVEPVTSPVKSTLSAIGKIASAGVLPMVMFCLTFVVANQLQLFVAWSARQIVGPGTQARNYALEPYIQLAERGVYFVVVLSLLAAAVNAVVSAQRTEKDAAARSAG